MPSRNALMRVPTSITYGRTLSHTPVRSIDQPVKRGAIRRPAQRWNERLNVTVFGSLLVSAANVAFMTRRCTPIFSLLGLTLSENTDVRPAFALGFVSVLTFLPSR